MKQFLLFVLFASTILSCEKVIEYKGPGGKSLLVLNAIMENDSVFQVNLERTVFFLSPTNTNRFISSGASFILSDLTNNVTYTNPVYLDSGRYIFPITVQEGTRYSISVSHPDFPQISAELSTQPKIQLIGVDTSSFIKNQQRWLKAILKFNDPIGENYYIVKGSIFFDSPDWQGFYPMPIMSNDLSVDNTENQDIDGSIYPTTLLYVSDTKFEGKYKELEITMQHPGNDDPEWELNIDLEFELQMMDKSTFLYKRSMIKQLYTDEFSEPVKVFTNISNGFGIFGTRSTAKWKM
jgi:hypothetical protein